MSKKIHNKGVANPKEVKTSAEWQIKDKPLVEGTRKGLRMLEVDKRRDKKKAKKYRKIT